MENHVYIYCILNAQCFVFEVVVRYPNVKENYHSKQFI